MTWLVWNEDPLGNIKKAGDRSERKWYEHKSEAVMENDKWKILWNFTVQTDHEIYGRRPDVIDTEG